MLNFPICVCFRVVSFLYQLVFYMCNLSVMIYDPILPQCLRLSPRGRSFTFDASADGYGRGEGSGADGRESFTEGLNRVRPQAFGEPGHGGDLVSRGKCLATMAVHLVQASGQQDQPTGKILKYV